MSKQTEKSLHEITIKQVLCNNAHALKTYWPILLLVQLPVLIVCGFLTYQKSLPPAFIAPDKKTIELHKKQNIHIKNLEQRLDSLNQRFLALQNQHAKIVKSFISFKTSTSSQKQETNFSSVNLVQKRTLETIDRIGEKIRLNEPFSGLLTSLPKDCSTFSGYKTLNQFSARLPLNFSQLKKAFEDIRKNHTPSKVNNNLPKWLEKIASIFHGNIKIEKNAQPEESPFQTIADALEVQDLKLAYSFAKDTQIQSIKLWAKLVAERILLEEDYSLFAEKIQSWVQHTPLENETASTNVTQENLP